jgi:hypothetical protein
MYLYNSNIYQIYPQKKKKEGKKNLAKEEDRKETKPKVVKKNNRKVARSRTEIQNPSNI